MVAHTRVRSTLAAMALVVGLGAVGGALPALAATASSTADASLNAPVVATVEDAVLFDEDGITITAKGLEQGSRSTDLKLVIENNTDTTFTVQCRNVSVNGYMVDALMSTEVAAGKKAIDTMMLYTSSLETCGIETIADIELSFHVFASDGWDTIVDTPQIQIQTSAYDGYVYEFDDTGEVLFEGEGITIVLKGLDEEASFMGPGVVFYIQNDSEHDITVQVRNESVNGFMVPGSMSCDIMAGKRAIDDVTFYSSKLEESYIDAIETVELSFHIFSQQGWDTIVDTDLIEMVF